MDEVIATAVHIIRAVGLAISFIAIGFTAYMIWFLALELHKGYNERRWMWITAMWTESNIFLLLVDIAAVRIVREVRGEPLFWLDGIGVLISISVFLAQYRLARWAARYRGIGKDARPPG